MVHVFHNALDHKTTKKNNNSTEWKKEGIKKGEKSELS